MGNTLRTAFVAGWLVMLGSALCGAAELSPDTQAKTGPVTDSGRSADWRTYGRTDHEDRYSPLDSVNNHNVKDLGLAWYLTLPGQTSLESTPLAINGVLYFTGTFAKTFAVDARTGRELWHWDAGLARHNPQKMRLIMGVNRGVAYWKGKIYVGTNDGRLVALDAKTGQVVWSVDTVGPEKENPRFISGAPRAFNGKVIIGNGSAEVGGRGYVTAYDAETGRKLWRFYTVPGDPKKSPRSAAEIMAAKTWKGAPKSWAGGYVWDSIVYDPEFNRVYIGTGNDIGSGYPDSAVRRLGDGDDLFVCSIVALDADTGQYLWHYQEVPGDAWDYDSTGPIILANLKVAGRERKVLMQAPKDGFFYVIDRATGKLISAEKFAKVTWASKVDLKSGRPVEEPGVHYENTPIMLWPGSGVGAHDWQPMSFNPVTGLVYLPTQQAGRCFGPEEKAQDTATNILYAVQFSACSYQEVSGDGKGTLLAWDPVVQQKRWEVAQDGMWNGGTMATAGNLVFQGTGSGYFNAYDAGTGEKLWSYYTGLGIISAPITYAVDGKQYVSILVGYGGVAGVGGKRFDYGWRYGEQPRRLLTFALDAQQPLPPGKPPRFTVHALDDPTLVIDPQQTANGAKFYDLSHCGFCHGFNLQNPGPIAPDLRESHLALNWQAFQSVLHNGTLADMGMPKFDDLSQEQLRAIYMYIRSASREAVPSARP